MKKEKKKMENTMHKTRPCTMFVDRNREKETIAIAIQRESNNNNNNNNKNNKTSLKNEIIRGEGIHENRSIVDKHWKA